MSAQPQPKGSDKTKKVLQEVEEVKNIMHDNVTKMTSNMVQLDVIEDKTANMVDVSGQFANRSKTLKRKMWWQNMKVNLIIAIVVIIVIAIIVLVVSIQANSYTSSS